MLEQYTLALFKRGTEMAAERGLILVDTKYEFGKHNGTIYLMDEIHTPDSSRYFYSEGYQERFEKGEAQKQLSKEFVREWLMSNGFPGQEGQQVPEMTDEIVAGISERYIELYEHITGETFVKENTEDIAARIEKNVTEWLTKRAPRPKYVFHSFGYEGIVGLTAEQYRRLLRLVDCERLHAYITKLQGLILEKGYRSYNHYKTLKKWILEDTAV